MNKWLEEMNIVHRRHNGQLEIRYSRTKKTIVPICVSDVRIDNRKGEVCEKIP